MVMEVMVMGVMMVMGDGDGGDDSDIGGRG